jgi:hypothetical protein
MRYWVPKLRVGSVTPGQTTALEKLGGLPWGFPRERWPVCKGCREPMAFLAELHHTAERLDLGAEGRVLFLFMCEGGECEPWEADAGCNAVFILERVELGAALTEPPTKGTRTCPELRIEHWDARDEAVEAADYPAFFDEAAHRGLPAHIQRAPSPATKLGGAPRWRQAAVGFPETWRFIGQLEEYVAIAEPCPTADEAGCTITREVGSGYEHTKSRAKKPFAPRTILVRASGEAVVDWANFGGSNGRGFLFVHNDGEPRAKFFWQ